MRKSILIFGGGPLQLSIIERVKMLGFRTIVIDPNPDAQGKQFADLFFQVDGDDFDRTLDVAKSNGIAGVVTAATDHPILMMSRIAAELHLIFPTYESCETVLDKGKFKSILKKNNINHAKGGVYKKEDLINFDEIKFPIIVKPLKNSGSRGVLKCIESASLLMTIEECLKYCNDGLFLVEEFIEGDEISVEAYVKNKEVFIIQITDKFVSDPPYNVELGHSQPSKFAERENEILNLLQKVVAATGLDNCILHPELKITDNTITVIEIGPRLGGDYITSDLVPLSTNINIEDIQINLAVGADFIIEKVEHASLISFLNFPNFETVVSEVNEKELTSEFPEIKAFHSSLKKGMVINPITNSLNRYGHFILQSNDLPALKETSKKIMMHISNQVIKN